MEQAYFFKEESASFGEEEFPAIDDKEKTSRFSDYEVHGEYLLAQIKFQDISEKEDDLKLNNLNDLPGSCELPSLSPVVIDRLSVSKKGKHKNKLRINLESPQMEQAYFFKEESASFGEEEFPAIDDKRVRLGLVICDLLEIDAPVTSVLAPYKVKTMATHTCDAKRWIKGPIVVFAEPTRDEPRTEMESCWE
ncbi:UNVERIFIED_CONTAM: hypothetical protein FKN15_025771 [Acipenser sinensis]